jgi:hypothetical protein
MKSWVLVPLESQISFKFDDNYKLLVTFLVICKTDLIDLCFEINELLVCINEALGYLLISSACNDYVSVCNNC